jgi:chromosome segregation ATPase
MEKFCDIFGVTAAAWARVDSEEKRLLKEDEKFRQEEEEAMAKILRLRKQAKKTRSQLERLRENAGKMLQYDLKTIEELEAFEEKERLEKERAEQALRNPSSSGIDPSLFELPLMSDSELAAWMEAVGSVDGISPNLVGSSGS